MSPVDVETLASSCVGGYSDRKVSCETLAVAAKDDGGRNLHDDIDNDFADVNDDVPPDFPPESFWLSKDAEIDWFDRNAFFERKESGKGISNSTNLNANSQRFSKNLKSKASIIGLPKTQQNYLDSKRRTNRPGSIQLFPKRSESTGKSTVSVIEPSSPKVSCMGRVRSKRNRRKPSENKKKREKSAHKSTTSSNERKKSFCSRLFSIFNTSGGGGGGDKSSTGRQPEVKTTKDEITPPRMSTSMRMREFAVDAEPPTLGGMKKLTSGRRSGAGTTEDFDVATSIQSEMLGPTKRI